MALAKTAVVVGVGPGLGAAVARRFGKEGYKVAVLSRDLQKLQPVVQQIEQEGGQALAVPCDAGKPEDVQRAFKQINDTLGPAEVLVYNAGPGFAWPPPGVLDVKPEDLASAFAIGTTGALVAAQQVLPAMLEAKKGTILFTGATASLRGGPKFIRLACPKFALRALAQSIAREVQPQGVHVAHVIVDGQIYLPTSRDRFPDRPTETFLDPDAMADTYWHLHQQHPTSWTHELDLRPSTEKW
ncbi:hypothetical protein WJX72_005341 [[Myrmecia] bisecta]|uniref:Uncharacterized protein n=1 Tax=[Myrmecia] bisecta TaxID=41462 RepID=A0AAW1PBE7_9CHLO